MAFCINCGKELIDDAKFCAYCGKEIININVDNDSNSKRKTIYEGEIHKCPICGEVLKAFVTNCPTCGYELRGTKNSSTVQEFAKKLDWIEKNREAEQPKSVLGKMYGNLVHLSQTDEQKINLIRNFVIPNNKEDISEFMILASSNIDTRIYSSYNTGVITTAQREISEAWFSKFEQAYQKAKFSFGNTPDINIFDDIYNKKIKEIRMKKLEAPLICIGCVIGMLLIVSFVFSFG